MKYYNITVNGVAYSVSVDLLTINYELLTSN